jgi:hypothetical protein
LIDKHELSRVAQKQALSGVGSGQYGRTNLRSVKHFLRGTTLRGNVTADNTYFRRTSLLGGNAGDVTLYANKCSLNVESALPVRHSKTIET